jgi:hypothetical protein
LPDDERMQKEIDRLMDWLESKNPSLSFDERMQKAEEIFERQELARIRMSKERTDALMAFVPQSNAGASIGLLCCHFIHSFIHSLFTHAYIVDLRVWIVHEANVVSQNSTFNSSAPQLNK